MIFLQTEKQKQAAKYPSKIEFMKIAHKRGLLSTEEQKQYRRMIAGETGELILLDYLNTYGNPDWKIIRNLWLDENGRCEIDALLLTEKMPYIFECKYYDGDFLLDENGVSINNYPIETNCVEQTRKISVKLNRILDGNPFGMANVFTNTNNNVRVTIDTRHTKIIWKSILKKAVLKIKEDERNYKGPQLDVDQFLKQLDPYELLRDPFAPIAMSKETMKFAKKGLSCSECGGFTIDCKRLYASCRNCGYKEDRETTTLRAISEYGILTFETPLCLKHIHKFLGKQVSENYLRNVLRKHFVVIGSGSHTRYENKRVPYERWEK